MDGLIKSLVWKANAAFHYPAQIVKKIQRDIQFSKDKNYPALCGPLAPNDLMYAGDMEHYIKVGREAISIIEQSIQLGGRRWDDLNAALDMPSGHGRVLRHLSQKMPASKITACEISEDQIDFCAQAFGCKKLLSSNDIPSIRFPEKYSLIWVGSLFTHLAEKKFKDLLVLLFEALEPNGILIFTAHGEYSLEVFEKYWRKGFAPVTSEEAKEKIKSRHGFYFWPYRRDPEFGVSISLKDYVFSLLGNLFNSKAKILQYIHRGWDNHQDVYAIQKVG